MQRKGLPVCITSHHKVVDEIDEMSPWGETLAGALQVFCRSQFRGAQAQTAQTAQTAVVSLAWPGCASGDATACCSLGSGDALGCEAMIDSRWVKGTIWKVRFGVFQRHWAKLQLILIYTVLFEKLSRVIARYPTLVICQRSTLGPLPPAPKCRSHTDTPGPSWFGFWSCRRDFAHRRCESRLARERCGLNRFADELARKF